MNGSNFDRLAQAVVGRSPRVARRTALSVATVAATGWLVAPTASEGKKKKKKKKPCPICPEPTTCPEAPPGPFCAGKNHCQKEAPCAAPGAAQGCFCYLRADNLKSICGQIASFASSCSSCTGGYVCAVAGGECADGFFCVLACPDPR
jgi:hypothetical protein